jgi:hypothetical protein
LIAVGAAYVRFALDEPGYFRLLFGAHFVELAAHPAAAAVKSAGQAAAGCLRRAIKDLHTETRVRVSELDLERILWGQVHGLAWLVLEHELRPAPSYDETVALAKNAIGAIVDGISQRPMPRARPKTARQRA